MGQQAGENWLSAMFGFLLTGAGLPLLGVIAVGYSGSRDVEALASRVAPWYGVTFCHCALSGNRPSVCHAAYGNGIF